MNVFRLFEQKAKSQIRRVLLVEGEDQRIVDAALMAKQNGICEPVLLVNEKNDSDLEQIELNASVKEELSVNLVELRKHKGMTKEQADKLVCDPNYAGALLLVGGKVDGAVGGCKFSTADWMRPVFQVVGVKKKGGLCSSICFFEIGDKTYFFSDTDFVIAPDAKQLSEIAINACGFLKGIGITPKVGFLSYSTKGSGEHPSLAKIREALSMFKKEMSDVLADGEVQLDAAISPKAYVKKCPDSELKGDANLLIFPEITVGNVLIHSLVQWTDYRFTGSFPIGLNKPVINGGRSFDAKKIYNLIVGCAAECNF